MAASLSTTMIAASTALKPFKLPSVSKLNIALCQLTVTLDKNQNLIHARNLIRVAAEQGARLVVLPLLAMESQLLVGRYQRGIKNRLYNTCYVFGPDGKLRDKHSKVHLFDIDIPGDILFKESETFAAGDNSTIVDTGAHLICYPGAFNMSTGKLLWDLVQRAR